MARLGTIPHAPITRVAHRTGEIEQLEPGMHVNVGVARGIFARVHDPAGPAVVVELEHHDWIFQVADDAAAFAGAAKLTQIAHGSGRR